MAERLVQNKEGFAAVWQVLREAADPRSVYGKPTEHHGRVIIPAAEVTTTLGFGFGMGAEPRDGHETALGGGGGSGGNTTARPVAAIVVEKDGVHVEPIIDVTKIALGVLALAGGWMWMRRRHRRHARST